MRSAWLVASHVIVPVPATRFAPGGILFMVEWYIVVRHNSTPQKNKEVHRRQQFRNWEAGACFIKNTVLGIRLSNKNIWQRQNHRGTGVANSDSTLVRKIQLPGQIHPEACSDPHTQGRI